MEIKLHDCTRLAAIDGYTGFKPQHRYVTFSPLRPPPLVLDSFFYSNTNNLVQLEDTKI